MIFGAVIDESMGETLRITVIATGFEREMGRRQLLQRDYGRSAPDTRSRTAETLSRPTHPPQRERRGQEAPPEPKESEREPVQPKFSPNNLDIPAFLRRR
jgi:cell division protein FtsZ